MEHATSSFISTPNFWSSILLSKILHYNKFITFPNLLKKCFKKSCNKKQFNFFTFPKSLKIFFWCIHPSSGLLPVLGPLEQYMTPALDAALLITSRAGADLGRTSDRLESDLLLTANV